MESSHKRVSIHWVKGILAAAESLGIDPQKILSELNLQLDLDQNLPAYLSLDLTQDIWSKAETLSGHDYFGLRMGQRVRPAYFHAVAYVAMTSRNLLEALKNFTHYLPLISEGAVLDVSFDEGQVWLQFTPTPDNKPFSRHQHESVMALLVAFSEWLIGDDVIKPIKVYFPHDPGPDMDEYVQVFDLVPHFNMPFTGILFPADTLKKTLLESDVGLNVLHKAHADQLLALHLNTSWKVKVIQIIVTAGHFSLNREQVAKKLNISTRTLQRRLQEEGTSFLDVIDDQRRQKALIWICNSHKSLKEVALDLGFSESSTFYRACHRWFDKTPNSMRNGDQR
jgi:AraC-like DNA-binding protein